MDDDADQAPRSTDGAEQLQRAAREVIGAARSFLDAVEEIVEDRDRLSGIANNVAQAVSDVVGRVTPGRADPWGSADEADDAHDEWTDAGWMTPPPPPSDEPEDPPVAKVRRIQVD
ncbi:MAG: hypothetical protein ACKOYM_02970 [Actinomycetes bacterium]